MKLEVGKSYNNRLGGMVKIIKKTGHKVYPFVGNNGETYTESGRVLDYIDGEEDIIREVNTRGGARKGEGRPRKTPIKDTVTTIKDVTGSMTWLDVAKALADDLPDAALWVLKNKVS